MAGPTRIGTTLAGYRLDRLIGRGGMSVVYLAEQTSLGRRVALKVLAAPLAADESFRERFEHESRRAAEIDHPNVIPIYDAGEADGELFIAMRHVDGRDLRTLIREEGRLDPDQALDIVVQTAAALDAAHARGLVHRDVKPANILIEEPSGHVYLTDFGIVKRTGASGLTRTGFFVGTIDYAAPEQIEGRTVDARTDVYALGCVLCECLTGRPPFEREGEVAVMHAHLAEAPPAPSATRSELPPAIDAVVGRAMAKRPEDRYPSAGELAVAAGAALGIDAETRPVRRPPPRRARPWWARPRLLLALAALLAAAALAAVLAVVLGGSEPSAPEAPASPPAAPEPAPSSAQPSSSDSPLADFVPAELWEGCRPAEPTETEVDRAACTSPFEPGVVRWRVSLFGGSDHLNTAYEATVGGRGDECGLPDGVGEWACFYEGQDAVLVWQHRPPGGRNVLGVARRAGGDSSGLYDWWKRWRDRIGAPGGAAPLETGG